MKKLATVLSCVTVVSCAFADDVFIGFAEQRVTNVTTDVVLSGDIVAAPLGRFRKAGEGELTIPSSKLFLQEEARIEVSGGTLKIDPTAAPTKVKPDGVDDILAIAASWFDCTKPASLVTEGDNITDWLDARETGNAVDGYVYSRAVADVQLFDAAGSGRIYPVLQTDADYGQKGVYFGGVKSGCWMKFLKPDGSKWSCQAYNVFAVHGVKSGLGNVLGLRKGSYTTANMAFVAGNSSGATFAPLWINMTQEVPAIHTAHTYVNGAIFDGLTGKNAYPKGFTLLEAEMLQLPGEVNCFYSDRGYVMNFPGLTKETTPSEFQWAGSVRVGGDYISEVVLFTNRLTSAQRLTVERYLMNKWFGIRELKSVDVTTATSAKVEVGPAQAGDEEFVLNLSGDGVLLKSGQDGTVLNRSFGGRIELGATADLNHECDPTFNLLPGEKYYAGRIRSYRYVTSRPDATLTSKSTCLVYGDDELKASSLATNIERLVVEGGTLRLTAPAKTCGGVKADGQLVSGVVTNWSFELGISGTDEYGFSNGGSFQGWHAVKPADGGTSEVIIFNSTKTDGHGTSTWGLPKNIPDGRCGLGLKQNGSAWTEIELPEDGTYRVSFLAAPRLQADPAHHGHRLELAVGTSADDLVVFGHYCAVIGRGKYWPYSYRMPYLTKGKYQLWFRSPGDNIDRMSIIDCVRVEREEPTDDWLLPNGNFEEISTVKDAFSNFKTFSEANAEALCHWTLIQPSEATSDDAKCGASHTAPATPGMYPSGRSNYSTNPGVFCDLREGDGTPVCLQLCYGGTASCTFVPPAGTWQLRADATTCMFSQHSENWIEFHATVTPQGGTETDLGMVEHAMTMRKQVDTFPGVIESDGETPVTVKIWCVRTGKGSYGTKAIDAHLAIDNVRLTPPVAGLVANGGFEDGWTPWTVYGTSTNSYGPMKCERLDFSNGNNALAYGSNLPEGKYCLRLLSDSMVTQTIKFPGEGDYRLEALMRSRAGYGESGWWNPGRFWYARGGVTNEICGFFTPGTTNFVRYSWNFRVKDAGEYTFGIEGGSPGVDRSTLVDEVSIKSIMLGAEAPDLNPLLRVSVQEGAKLRLDYPGTVTVSRVSFNGRLARGVVTAETDPDYVTGPGAMEVVPVERGMFIILK